MAGIPTSNKDPYGFIVENTPMDEMRVIEPTRLVGTTFEGTTIDTNFWTVTSSGTGATSAQANGELTISSGTANSGYTYLQTVRSGRYIGASANRYRAQIRLGDTGTANNTKEWGVMTASFNDGAYFQLSGTTFNVCTKKGGSETAVASTSFSGQYAAPTFTNINTYEIYYTNKSVYFIINGKLIHTVTAGAASWSASKNFQVVARTINGASGTTSCDIISLVATISRLGKQQTVPKFYNRSTTTAGVALKLSQGTLHSLLLNSCPTSGAVVTLYDSATTTANPIGSWTLAFPGGGNFNPTAIPFSVNGVPFFNGLYLVIATQAADVTVIYE